MSFRAAVIVIWYRDNRATVWLGRVGWQYWHSDSWIERQVAIVVAVAVAVAIRDSRLVCRVRRGEWSWLWSRRWSTCCATEDHTILTTTITSTFPWDFTSLHSYRHPYLFSWKLFSLCHSVALLHHVMHCKIHFAYLCWLNPRFSLSNFALAIFIIFFLPLHYTIEIFSYNILVIVIRVTIFDPLLLSRTLFNDNVKTLIYYFLITIFIFATLNHTIEH